MTVEEELLQMELDAGKHPRGLGGYGTLGPFTYSLLVSLVGQCLGLEGATFLALFAVCFIYTSQFLLYSRV